MERVLHIHQLLLRSRRLPWLLGGATLAVLAGAILLTTLQVRRNIREQIAGRDGEVLHAVALMEYADDVAQGLEGPITDPGSQLSIVLKSARLKGVLGVRLFDAGGEAVESFPPDVRDQELTLADLPALKRLKPVSRFHPAVAASELFYSEAMKDAPSAQALPLLEVNVPLHAGTGGRLAGIAQYLLEGHSIAAEYARLDRHLMLQALGTFAVSGGILALVLAWSFARLRHAHRLLARRSEDLVKANQELALAAKTSALGAVTAHLIHGLKNPLAGLQSFVAAHGGVDDRQAADWQQAVASTRRMQSMISQVVGVLREQETGVTYQITPAELVEMVGMRLEPVVRQSGVRWIERSAAEGALPNRAANLALLILVNVGQNALEATPAGSTVTLTASRTIDQILFEVSDQGTGFPSGTEPFAPCRSSKEGGSGIGLALSKQLANHLGATLELKRNSPQGCVFELGLPLSLCLPATTESPDSVVMFPSRTGP